MTTSLKESVSLCLAWWNSLTGQENIASRNSGHIAELRRSSSVLDVVSCPVYHTLARTFPWLDPDDDADRLFLDKIAICAHVLSHVRENDDSLTVGRQLGLISNGSSSAPMSELRFRRLVQVSRHSEMFQHLRRLVGLIDNRTNVADLAELILRWGQPYKMKKFAFDYYGANNAPVKPKQS